MSLRLSLVSGVLLGLSANALAADWVGVQTCKACHPQAAAVWEAGPHARAASSLTDAQRQDASCTRCHAPDLPLEPAAQQAGARPPTPEQRAGITCESCHGAGQYYSPGYVMRDAELARAVGLVDPSERSCRACHTAGAPGLSSFDFAAKVKLIDHWSAHPPPVDPALSPKAAR
ncbi:MAG: multiheme c-type cytochrome [Deltaproteobacteria bacterium]